MEFREVAVFIEDVDTALFNAIHSAVQTLADSSIVEVFVDEPDAEEQQNPYYPSVCITREGHKHDPMRMESAEDIETRPEFTEVGRDENGPIVKIKLWRPAIPRIAAYLIELRAISSPTVRVHQHINEMLSRVDLAIEHHGVLTYTHIGDTTMYGTGITHLTGWGHDITPIKNMKLARSYLNIEIPFWEERSVDSTSFRVGLRPELHPTLSERVPNTITWLTSRLTTRGETRTKGLSVTRQTLANGG